MKYKELDWKVQDIDEPNRRVLIYVSEFGSKDSDGDIITSGAFTKTLNDRGPKSNKPRIRHLVDHWSLVGRPIEMSEDEKGLLVLSEISNSTLGRDTIENYKINLYEHSIGFEVIKAEQGDNVQYLTELKLWEYSSVTWGANSNTPLVDMKGFSIDEIIKRVNARMDSISYGLRKGNYTDEGFETLEVQLNTLKKQYNDLINSLRKPSQNTSQQPDFKALGEIFDNFKI